MNKNFLTCRIAFGLLILSMLISCSHGVSSDSDGSISIDEFARLTEDPKYQILDVRTEQEFRAGHIHGALNLDVKTDGFGKHAASMLDKTRPVLVYCHLGQRSKIAMDILKDMGYEAYNVKDGIINWTGKIDSGIE
ncbi:MAG: rhodanese-like domain-containing protein [Marinilabiliaceae bacterium]|nr:rhodanese-like domain-containing protein [Marinilabiliaceae bacterium]